MRRFTLLAAVAALAACGEEPSAHNDAAYAPVDEAAPGPTANTIMPPAASAAMEPATNTPTTNTPEPAEPTPTNAASDYRQPMRLTGTEPFWGVQIGDKITLQRPDYPNLVVANAGPSINGDVAVWNARDITIRLEPQAGCSDGMSDNRYPYAARVTVKGEVLKGCAARADQWPRGGG